jgi:hypothetical protein
MAVPTQIDARIYYRCAVLRLDEAKVLFRADYTTGAVYLAGYGIECILKALVLANTPKNEIPGILRLFRGPRAHEYEWLLSLYFRFGGARLPVEIAKHLTIVNDWSTDLRYSPGIAKAKEAQAFLNSSDAIIKWADGRI